MKIQEAIELLIIVHSERYSTRKLRKIERKLIQNQEILEQIIKKGFSVPKSYNHYTVFTDNPIRTLAIKYVTNSKFLEYIAINADGKYCRQAAVNNPNLTNERILAKVTKNDKSYYVSLNAMRKINNQKILMKVFQSIKDSGIQKETLKRITDEKFLYNIALNHKDYDMRIVAAKNIKDTEKLTVILENEPNKFVTKKLIKEINNQEVLKNIIFNSNYNIDAKITAINNITDEKILIYIAKSSINKNIRASAISNPNLKDEEILIDFLKYDHSSEVRFSALKKITRQDILIDVALHENDWKLVLYATERIKNKNVLMEIRDNYIHKNYYFCQNINNVAENRLNDINKMSRYRQLELLNED